MHGDERTAYHGTIGFQCVLHRIDCCDRADGADYEDRIRGRGKTATHFLQSIIHPSQDSWNWVSGGDYRSKLALMSTDAPAVDCVAT